jgi:hypothetical protein
MLFMWGPGGANPVRMGDALVIVPGAAAAGPGRRTMGELPSLPRRHLHPAGRPRHDSQAGSVWAPSLRPCVIDNREGASLT